jgi:hypothetical protein
VSTVVAYTIAFAQIFALSYSYVVVGAVMVGGSWYLARLARGPHSKPKLRSNSPNSQPGSTQLFGLNLIQHPGMTLSRTRTSK